MELTRSKPAELVWHYGNIETKNSNCNIQSQTCQVSHIRHETHTFEVYLTLSQLRLKSHAFASTAVMLFSSIASVIFHYYHT